ncbi:MAG: zinc metallopeptidase [Thermoguttaceae bacterium]|nr:zinc metallopeptidase [Thermoguttaceae bacterium]
MRGGEFCAATNSNARKQNGDEAKPAVKENRRKTLALYLLFIIPPMILAMVAQGLVSSRYASAKQMPASLTGAAAARRVLDSVGLQAVEIERVPGHLTDHYDPSAKVLRLSDEVYDGRNLAAIGIAAHEAGHAIQDAKRYAPMVVRQLAVPAASFGSNSAFLLIILGAAMNAAGLILAGVLCFGFCCSFICANSGNDTMFTALIYHN